MLSREELLPRINWLELEMGYEWSPKLNGFVNLDVELELGRDGTFPIAFIPARWVRQKLSLRTFQRAVKILVDRTRGIRGPRAKSNSH